MTMTRRCDGCQRQIKDRDDHVRVEREDPTGIMRHPDLPADGEPFHWCRDCAVYAITALAARDE